MIFSLLTLPIFSQSLQDNLEAEPAEVAEVAEKNFIEKGVYENVNKFLLFEENDILQRKNKEKDLTKGESGAKLRW